MNDILDKIITATRLRIEREKKEKPLDKLIKSVSEIGSNPNSMAFEQALKNGGIKFIMEVKKASPSKGIIAQDFPYVEIAKEYEEIGAAALSVLTEPEFFLGSDKYLQEIKQHVKIPVLRKDFIIDEYQIYQSRLIGADAILLICAALAPEQLSAYLKLANSLGLACLVEVHSEFEIKMALDADAKIIGVNNRNLKTFEVDITTSERLRPFMGEDKIFVSESGIKTAQDIERLRKIHTNAVLVGETFMRSENKKEAFKKLCGEK